MLSYIDQLITRYVLLDDDFALKELYRCILPKYHLAHFVNQKKIFIPLLYKLLEKNLKLEDKKNAQELIKRNHSKNMLALKLACEFCTKFHQIQAEPIIISEFSSYIHNIWQLKERCFDEVCFYIQREKLLRAAEILNKLGWQQEGLILDDEIKFKGKVRFKHYNYPKVELCTNFFGVDPRAHLEKFKISGVEINTVDLNLAFYIACMNQYESSSIYDAIKIAQRYSLNWTLLTQIAVKSGSTFYFTTKLKYLKQFYNLQIPNQIIENLEQTALTFSEKLEKLALNSNSQGAKEQLLLILAKYIREKKERNLSIFNLPTFINQQAD